VAICKARTEFIAARQAAYPGCTVYCTRLRGPELNRDVIMIIARIEGDQIFAYDPHWGKPATAKDVTDRVKSFGPPLR
jgi:hypothetical protein